MRFSMICPSRSRPVKNFNTVLYWHSKFDFRDGDQLEIWVSLDESDPLLYEYKRLYEPHKGIYILVSDNKSAVEAINNAAEKSEENILIVVSDDSHCPENWNNYIKEATKGKTDWILKVDDGIQKRIITQPIMDRAYYNRDKHIYDPEFRHSWADTWLTELAHKRGRVITRLDIKFPHNHYSVIGEQPDELYQCNDKTHDEDRHIYKRKMKTLHA